MTTPRVPARPGRAKKSPALARLIDVASVVTVVPLVAAAWIATRAAWQVYHPQRRPIRQTPETFGMTAEQVTVPGADGVGLACWYVPAPDARDVVVLGHGMGRNSGMLMPLAKMLHDAGYHVLTFDMRNHGNSADDGLFRGQSPRYSVDFHQVVRYLRTRPELAGAQVACLGFSMSAWTALEAARLEPDLVRAVVCDSGPTMRIGDTLWRMYEFFRGQLPQFMRGPLMFRLGRFVFTRASVFFLKPAPWPHELPNPELPILFIGGEADPVARPDDIREMAAFYRRAEVWLVPRAGHMQSHILASDEYAKRVLALFTEAFERGRVAGTGAREDVSGPS